MRYSKIFPKTRRDDPSDFPSAGSRMLIRGGFISQAASGIWIMTPLGLIVRRLIEQIIREEMERIGAIELELPILQPKELWERSHRWAGYVESNTSFKVVDQKGNEFFMAPTAEEVVTDFASRVLQTYRDLPITFWQMSPKFRDEEKPHHALIRCREFVMKDAYSFGIDPESMKQAFDSMELAYNRVFRRCGFNFIKVEADSGAIGGSGSAEFMAFAEFGDVLLQCTSNACDYGGNQEKTSVYYPPHPNPKEPLQGLREIQTPNIRTVQELEQFVGLPANKMAKTIVMTADDTPVIVTMRGDLEISEIKLANLLGVTDKKVKTADAETVISVTGAPVGFAGPIDLYGSTAVPWYFDRSVKDLRNFLCGANKKDVHYVNVNPGRDFPQITNYYDLAKAVAGQYCPKCKTNALVEKRGIELGHIFQLQDRYSKPTEMDAGFANGAGEKIPFSMGCYGIGVSRIVQTIVEQRNDDRGIIWPWSLTPYQVSVIPVNADKNLKDAERIYKYLEQRGFRVLLDDRDARIGEKLTDHELLGWPLQVLVGRTWERDQTLEVRWRDVNTSDGARFVIPKAGTLPTAFMSLEEFAEFCANQTRVSISDSIPQGVLQ